MRRGRLRELLGVFVAGFGSATMLALAVSYWSDLGVIVRTCLLLSTAEGVAFGLHTAFKLSGSLTILGDYKAHEEERRPTSHHRPVLKAESRN